MSPQLENIKDIPSFRHFFSTDIFIIRITGLSSMSGVFTNAPREAKWWEPLRYFHGTALLISLSGSLIAGTYYAAKSDIYYMIEALGVSVTGLLITFKAVRIWTRRDELYNILQVLATCWHNAKLNGSITAEMLKTAELVKFIRLSYYGVVVSVSSSYCLRPYLLLLNHQLYNRNESYDFSVSSYPAVYPFTFTTYPTYFICLIYENMTTVFGLSCWIVCDGLFAQITVHLSLQFEILAHELSQMDSTENPSYDESTQTKNLCSISGRHSKMFLYCAKAENFFNPILFLTVLINSADCCFCVFSLEQNFAIGDIVQILKMLFRTMAVCGQTIVYCAYADRLAQQSSKLSEAIYNCPWTNQPRNIKLMLLIMLMRSQKEYKYTAYGIVTLNLQKVTAIANAAMRYFTLLRSFT